MHTSKETQGKRQDRQSLVWSPCTTSDQETEWVYSYNPGARTGQLQLNRSRIFDTLALLDPKIQTNKMLYLPPVWIQSDGTEGAGGRRHGNRRADGG